LDGNDEYLKLLKSTSNERVLEEIRRVEEWAIRLGKEEGL
jgi:hypothetical protein